MARAKADAPNLDKLSMLDEKGGRRYVLPADVKGRFRRLKPWIFGVLIVVYVGLPFLTLGGHPAVLIDLPNRHFYLFGSTFNAQDFYLFFFVLTGIGFALIVLSALWGRVWCGWACPQTVFLDGVFRQLERWIEGPAPKRARLNAGPWTLDKLWRKGLKHALYLVLAVAIAQVFIAYFIGAEGVYALYREGAAAHPAATTWAAVMSVILYFNFWWFREQLCIVICPYGRLQSALQDDDTFIIGYDAGRGEPRGKASDKDAGDCVDCGRCVAVCPTAIDIRNGLQLECIGCAYCIDACDEIMDKLGRPRGLIRYDSQRGLTGGTRRFWRPRVFYYVFAGLLGLSVAAFAFTRHNTAFEANVLRVQGVPFTVGDAGVENRLMVHVVNKNEAPSTLAIAPGAGAEGWVTLPQRQVDLPPFGDHKLPVLVNVPRDAYTKGMKVPLVVTDGASGLARTLEVELLGPARLTPRTPTP